MSHEAHEIAADHNSQNQEQDDIIFCIGGFSDALNLELKPGSLSAEEEGQVQALIKDRFGDPSWTRGRQARSED